MNPRMIFEPSASPIETTWNLKTDIFQLQNLFTSSKWPHFFQKDTCCLLGMVPYGKKS